MGELRQRCSGCLGGLEDEYVLVCIGKMVLTADDVTDLQIDVVGTRRQVVGGHAVAAEQGEVFDVVGGFGLMTVDGVGKADVFAGTARDSEAQCKSLAGGGTAIAFGAA